ncbi:formate--phosphoribosylaminoimidazolecarboxamide ligase [Candidatus Gottesmanbacteria bacterium]|nr:formate--phosphoribosylaminoimidazolecarboxamide ligase [Candidatus Gottesmanbacteria bacterium]
MKHQHFTIATLGSHSALQILKGAKDEGFKTLLVVTKHTEPFYRRFTFIDDFIVLRALGDVISIEKSLRKRNVILIPHGSFVAYLGKVGNKRLTVPYYGNKKVLDWEADRTLQRRWLTRAGIHQPKQYRPDESIRFPVIVKSFGAAGGSGYFIAANKAGLDKKIKAMKQHKYVIQQYVVGVTCYLHYFYSPLTKSVELMSIDRRYETNADALGRIPLTYQTPSLDPSFVVVGNSPLVLRESLLPEVLAMAERIVSASQKLIDPRGLFGPFCLETIITPDQKFYAMEISCRIVAGTNLFIEGSPYTWLTYNEPMSTGRRIAREIKTAINKNKLALLTG